MYTYIAAFLTLACNYKCPYCINRMGSFKHRKSMSGDDWIRALSRIDTSTNLPITLQGGEPTLHPDFYRIVRTLYLHGKYMDILTNFNIDYTKWLSEIPTRAFSRPSKYPGIRVSYHPGQSSILGLFLACYRASRVGYSIGIWAVDHPAHRNRVRILQAIATSLGLEFRKKEFLGWYDHAFYGEYKYEDAVSQKDTKCVECKSNELLIAPDGVLHRCHADLYANRNPIGHILDATLPKIGVYRPCTYYGQCNACDIKLKTDRFQRGGFCSVEIRSLDN